MQEISNENYKTSNKEIEQDTNKNGENISVCESLELI